MFDIKKYLAEARGLPAGGPLDTAMGMARGKLRHAFDLYLNAPTTSNSNQVRKYMQTYEKAAKELEQYHRQTR